MNTRQRMRIAVVTGARAEFGLLRSTMRAITEHTGLDLQIIVAGVHLLPDINSREEIAAEFEIAAEVPMQRPGESGRNADAEALGRGVTGFAHAFAGLDPDVALVLGDRIEAFAAAAAATVGGRILAHVHGGDRAEGVADEALRHAISKLAHVHYPATESSARRLIGMGEDHDRVHIVGSPAIDGLDAIAPLDDAALRALSLDPTSPFAVILHHPSGLTATSERRTMESILAAVESHPATPQSVLFAPNHDPGRLAVLEAIGGRPLISHLPRHRFIGLLRRAALLIGNSSAGLIEAAALGLRVVNVGPRQAGRERPGAVVDVEATEVQVEEVRRAIEDALRLTAAGSHPYGDGRTGERIAAHLAGLPEKQPSTRKRNRY